MKGIYLSEAPLGIDGLLGVAITPGQYRLYIDFDTRKISQRRHKVLRELVAQSRDEMMRGEVVTENFPVGLATVFNYRRSRTLHSYQIEVDRIELERTGFDEAEVITDALWWIIEGPVTETTDLSREA